MTAVMVVEDDENIQVAVATQLHAVGLDVHICGDLASADRALRERRYDCAVFDRMLPDGDAIGYVHTRRQRGWRVPVLFLTARDSLADRVAGFEHGADDYLVKPFAMAELTERVVNLCHRAGVDRPSVYANDVLDAAQAPGCSGGPWLQDFDPATGQGVQIGVNSRYEDPGALIGVLGWLEGPKMEATHFGAQEQAVYELAQTSTI